MADINLGVGGANSAVAGGYDIDNSLKFEADNTEYLERDPSSTGNRKIFTTSMWVKRTELGQASTIFGVYPTSGAGNTTVVQFGFTSDDKFQCGFQTFYVVQTNRVFRDTSAWMHIVVRIDTTQSTATDRFKVWINGVEETSFSIDGRASIGLNQDTGINFTEPHRIGTLISNSWYFSGYMADINHIDGSAKSPTDFGETDEDSGIWKPKAYTGSYGTNGFYLDFESSGSLGADSSGNSNNFTLNNIAAADQATDTPTNNFCTLNVIANIENNAVVFTEGATVGSVSGGGNVSDHAMATMGFSSGKWYYEAYVTTGSTNDDAMFGFANTNGWYQGLGNYTFSAGAHNVGRWYYNSNTFTTTGATAWDKGDIVQIAIDCDNGKCWSGVNGTYSSGDPSTNTGGFDWDANVTDMSIGDLVIPVTRVLYTAPGTTYYNFGGYTLIPISSAASDANGYGTFEYAPPTGFYAICGKNLAEYGGTA